LADALTSNSSLRSLELQGNSITADTLFALSRTLAGNLHLRRLKLPDANAQYGFF
jgi:hypothetical protein